VFLDPENIGVAVRGADLCSTLGGTTPQAFKLVVMPESRSGYAALIFRKKIQREMNLDIFTIVCGLTGQNALDHR